MKVHDQERSRCGWPLSPNNYHQPGVANLKINIQLLTEKYTLPSQKVHTRYISEGG